MAAYRIQQASLADVEELAACGRAAFANDILAKAVCPPSEVDEADEKEFRLARLRVRVPTPGTHFLLIRDEHGDDGVIGFAGWAEPNGAAWQDPATKTTETDPSEAREAQKTGGLPKGMNVELHHHVGEKLDAMKRRVLGSDANSVWCKLASSSYSKPASCFVFCSCRSP